MALTDKNLISQRPHLDGAQRVYRVGSYGLSLVNGPMLHGYPFAWEAGVFDYSSGRATLTYRTPLTSDVEVFATDEEANAFIERAFVWFEEQQSAAA